MEFIRPKKASLSLDMAPLIDIVFQLLIFFMLSSSFLTPALKLDLPKAVKTDRDEPEQVIVSIEKDGSVFLNTRRTSFEQLSSDLGRELRAKSKKAVHLRGDRQMPYEFFVRAMEAAKRAKANQILIVHEASR